MEIFLNGKYRQLRLPKLNTNDLTAVVLGIYTGIAIVLLLLAIGCTKY